MLGNVTGCNFTSFKKDRSRLGRRVGKYLATMAAWRTHKALDSVINIGENDDKRKQVI